jgi:hypothetical protein
MTDTISVPSPDLQIDFAESLAEIRELYLQDALLKTAGSMRIKEIDKELADLVPDDALGTMALKGLRGELLFPVPCILRTNPFLLAYYRLLLGFSRKAFYTTEYDLSRFVLMEDQGRITSGNTDSIEALCKALIKSAVELLRGLNSGILTGSLLDDLTLLTLGAQLRGGANVQKGIVGIKQVFDVIEDIVQPYIVESTPREMHLRNAANRTVLVQFAPDPDIIILEEMSEDNYRNVIAIEVKAGEDYSNIHNRIGEAEKSHQKARPKGFVECWTVYNVNGLDMEIARKESPSTNRFYRLDDLLSHRGPDFEDFKRRIISLTGIPADQPTD